MNMTEASSRISLHRLPPGPLIAVFGFCLIAAAWAGVWYRLAYEREDEIERKYRENGALARAFEEHVRRVLRTADNALLFLKTEYEKRGAPTESMKDFVERAKDDPILNQLALANADGDLILSAVRYRQPINIAHREHFQKHKANAALGLDIGRPIAMQVSGTRSFFLSRRLNKPDGSFGGIVSAGLNPKYFSDFYDVPEMGEDNAIVVVGRDGIVRAMRFRGQVEVGQNLGRSPLFRGLSRDSAGRYEVFGVLDGLPRLVSYRSLGDYPLIVTVSTLKDAALAPFQRRRAAYFAAASLFTLFVAGFCALLGRAERRTRLQNERLLEELAERKKAEEALLDSQGLFTAFMDHLPAVVFLKDLQDKVLYTNEAFRRLFGESLVGSSTLDLPSVDKSVAEKMRLDDQRALREGSILVEETVRARDGSDRTFETRKFVVARRGKPPFLGGISVDISERRQEEQERLSFETQMQQAQKMESLGILAGGIAHDFNNLLMAIMGNIELALAKSPPESAARSYLRRADTAAQRAAELTNQMLAYSGKGRFVVGPLNLSLLVEEMQPLLATVISKRATLRQRLAKNLPPVEADATQLRQVLMNLITNASDALGDGEGVITVATSMVVAGGSDEGPSAGLEGRRPGSRYVCLEVSDDGRGMDAATQERIFDPFFTTKETGRGLGLAAVLGIVRGHRGEIQLSSEAGRGTTFRVLIPATPEVGGPTPTPVAASASDVLECSGEGTVLLVDDDESVRATTQTMLEEQGYTILTARDGVEAVEVYRAKAKELAAVVLDMTMPRMGGEEAFEQLRRIDPAVPVILSSGYHEREAGARFAGKGLAGFVQKPYRAAALAEKLKAAIAARPSKT